jgi:hypothetical protein
VTKATTQETVAITQLKADAEFKRAWQAFRECMKDRPGRDYFADRLPEILAALIRQCAIAAAFSGEPFSQSLARDKAGKMPKALREFPERIRSMADEIDRIDGDLFVPSMGAASHLRAYTDALEVEPNKILHAAAELTKRFPMWRAPKRIAFVAHLSLLTRKFTKSPCDKQVADLWNAATGVLNPSDERTLDTKDVADARRRTAPRKFIYSPKTLLGG